VACALALLLAGLYGYPLRNFAGFTAVPGGLGDARFNAFVLEHVYRWISGLEPSLWSPRIFFPFANALALSDSHLGTAPVYAAFRVLGLARETAFDGWFLVGNIATFLGCYWALRRFGLDPLPAGVGAFAFTFGSPALAQLGHAQLLYRFAIPPALFALWQSFETRRALPLWRLAPWTAIQFLCSIYLGLFLVYLLIVGGLALLMLHGWRPLAAILASLRTETAARWGLLIGSLVLALCAVGLLMQPYLRASIDYGFGPRLTAIAEMLPRPVSYLLADTNAFYGPVSRRLGAVPMRHEHQMFFGLAIWVGLVAGIATTIAAPRWRRLGLFTLIALGGLGLATLSVDGLSLYLVLAPLPGVGAIRAVSRVALVMLLPVGILAGLGVQGMLDWLRARARPAAVAAAIAVTLLLPIETLLEPVNNTPIAGWRQRLAALRSKLPQPMADRAILFVTSNADDSTKTDIDAMLLAQELGIPTLNGYSGGGPPGYGPSFTCVTAEQRLAGYSFFRNLPLEAIAPLAARTVTVEQQPCSERNPRVVRMRTFGPDIASRIGLSIANVRRAGTRVRASVAVENRSGERLDPLSARDESLKLSWRFVPVGTAMPLGDGWDTRFDLAESIEPGETRRYELDTELPEGGPFLLQVSMVQERVFWLHDHGLTIASAPVPPAPPP
jgi:hypothetical protein